MAITGALWYQGENNIGDCFGPKRVLGDGRSSPGRVNFVSKMMNSVLTTMHLELKLMNFV